MKAGAGRGEVQSLSKEPLSDSWVLVGKSVLSQLTHPQQLELWL